MPDPESVKLALRVGCVFVVGMMIAYWLFNHPEDGAPTRWNRFTVWLRALIRHSMDHGLIRVNFTSSSDGEDPPEYSENEDETGPKRNTETRETEHQEARNTTETAAFGETAYTAIAKLHAAGAFRDKFGETEALECVFSVKPGSSKKYQEARAELKRVQASAARPAERFRQLDEHSRPVFVTKAAEK